MAFGTVIEIGEQEAKAKALPLAELLPRARLILSLIHISEPTRPSP